MCIYIRDTFVFQTQTHPIGSYYISALVSPIYQPNIPDCCESERPCYERGEFIHEF